ncbi:hypothetical protein TSUD_125280 [Trifolium subterraneum]|uniref:Uncharacterized protein n=1 Tax=Trifolium subterraneum TaxID=3900 RepID=A0A2Z6M766_TRISU|nr:hypothetical protein TSUD_125280 [Trifolium subterraneum]
MHQRGEKHPSRGKNPSSDTEPRKVVGGVIRRGVTFKQSLVKGINATRNPGIDVGCKKPNTKRKVLASQSTDGCMEVEIVPENVTKFEKCWVGRLWDQNDADNIQFKIWMEVVGGDDACVRGLCSKNRVESEASVGSPNRRWVADDDNLHGDWSRCSSPERPLQLDSNVVAVDPLGISKIQIVADTMASVPIDVSIERENIDFQQQSSVPFEEVAQTIQKEKGKGVMVGSSIGPKMEGVDISADEVVADALVESSVAKGGQHRVGFKSEGSGLLGADFCRGKSKARLGFSRLGPGGCLTAKNNGGLWKGGGDEVARLKNIEEQNKYGLLVGPVSSARCPIGADSEKTGCRKGNNQKRNSKKAGVNGGLQVVEGTMQLSDPIQEMSDVMVYGERDGGQVISVQNLEEKGSLLEGISAGDQNLCSSNFCIEAERLFNIGVNLGVSSNEERVSMIERLMEMEGVGIRPEEDFGDVMVDQ